MQITITGHTNGIGKYLFEKLKLKGFSILGFSRSNGFDISNESDRQQILELSKDSDIFINCAYNYKNYDNSQLLLLQGMFEVWNNDISKHIINFSSAAADLYPLKIVVPNQPNLNKYVEDKHNQDQWLNSKRDYLNSTKRVKLTNIKPSRVVTEKTAKIWNDNMALTPADIANVILFIIDNPHIEFSNITLKRF